MTARPQETGFLDRSVKTGARTFPYAVYVPHGWTPDRTWPVILFLHGAGERGNDGLRPTQVGLGASIRFDPSRVPAVVVFPQAPPDERWIGEPADAAMAALERTMREFRGDPSRVYLTGMSMGGYGAWHLALLHPDRFAAIVTVCGGIVPNGTATSVRQSPLTTGAGDPYAFTARRLRHVPVWMFHGAHDDVVSPDESRRMREALLREGAEVRYTEYPEGNHNAWDAAYGDAEMWTWLFAKSLR